MKFKLGNLRIHIEPLILIFIVLVVAFADLRNYFSNYIICFLFVAFHESAHIFTASLLDVECTDIRIKLCGMNAVFKPKSKLNLKWLYILMAGPLSNMILATAFNKNEFVRDINWSLALINLLPIYPLDGYSILKMLLEFLLPKHIVNNVLRVLKVVVLAILVSLSVYLLIEIKNPSILIFVIYIVVLRSARLSC